MAKIKSKKSFEKSWYSSINMYFSFLIFSLSFPDILNSHSPLEVRIFLEAHIIKSSKSDNPSSFKSF